jgi:hypothetical protein
MARKKKGPGRPKDPKSLRSRGVDRHTQPSKRFHGPAELFDRLAAYCRRAQVPESQVLRDSLDGYLASRKA